MTERVVWMPETRIAKVVSADPKREEGFRERTSSPTGFFLRWYLNAVLLGGTIPSFDKFQAYLVTYLWVIGRMSLDVASPLQPSLRRVLISDGNYNQITKPIDALGTGPTSRRMHWRLSILLTNVIFQRQFSAVNLINQILGSFSNTPI